MGIWPAKQRPDSDRGDRQSGEPIRRIHGHAARGLRGLCALACREVGFPKDMLILGGDHLGPLTWSTSGRRKPWQRRKCSLTRLCARGFRRSIWTPACAFLTTASISRFWTKPSQQAAQLCAVAERAAKAGHEPVYVIGSEVPVPGGATENEDALSVTPPENLDATVAAFRAAFEREGLKRGVLPRDRGRGAARCGVRGQHDHHVPAGEGKAPDGARQAASVHTGGALDRLPADECARRYAKGRNRDPQGRPRADVCAAGGALRARKHGEGPLRVFPRGRVFPLFGMRRKQRLMQQPKYWGADALFTETRAISRLRANTASPTVAATIWRMIRSSSPSKGWFQTSTQSRCRSGSRARILPRKRKQFWRTAEALLPNG